MDTPASTRAGRLAAWSTALLQRRCPRDAAVGAVTGGDARHLVADVPGLAADAPLARFLDHLVEHGVTGLRYLPAAPGDASALPGPTAFNGRAVAAGGAVVTVDGPVWGLVATVAPNPPVTVVWHVEAVERRPVPPVDLRAARLRLVEQVAGCLDTLHRLDVVSARPQAAELVDGWGRSHPASELPPGSPAEAVDLLVRTTHLRQVVELALADEGGAVTGWESHRRREVLTDLTSTLRQVAADAWNCGLDSRRQSARSLAGP